MRRDVLCAVLLVIVLAAVFSLADPTAVFMPSNGSNPEWPGNSGTELPGNGTDFVDIIFVDPTQSKSLPDAQTQLAETQAAFNKADDLKNKKEDSTSMDEMVIAFWHGVASVLIGEANALLVAMAWSKIRGERNGLRQ